MPLVLAREHEPPHADFAPPHGPPLGRRVALLARQIVVVAEVLAGEAAQIADRGLADRVFLVREAFDQPLDAMAAARTLVPLAPLLLVRAEVLHRQRDERFARVLAPAVG